MRALINKSAEAITERDIREALGTRLRDPFYPVGIEWFNTPKSEDTNRVCRMIREELKRRGVCGQVLYQVFTAVGEPSLSIELGED